MPPESCGHHLASADFTGFTPSGGAPKWVDIFCKADRFKGTSNQILVLCAPAGLLKDVVLPWLPLAGRLPCHVGHSPHF